MKLFRAYELTGTETSLCSRWILNPILTKAVIILGFWGEPPTSQADKTL